MTKTLTLAALALVLTSGAAFAADASPAKEMPFDCKALSRAWAEAKEPARTSIGAKLARQGCPVPTAMIKASAPAAKPKAAPATVASAPAVPPATGAPMALTAPKPDAAVAFVPIVGKPLDAAGQPKVLWLPMEAAMAAPKNDSETAFGHDIRFYAGLEGGFTSTSGKNGVAASGPTIGLVGGAEMNLRDGFGLAAEVGLRASGVSGTNAVSETFVQTQPGLANVTRTRVTSTSFEERFSADFALLGTFHPMEGVKVFGGPAMRVASVNESSSVDVLAFGPLAGWNEGSTSKSSTSVAFGGKLGSELALSEVLSLKGSVAYYAPTSVQGSVTEAHVGLVRRF